MIKMDIKADVQEAAAALQALGVAVGGPGIGKKILRALATAGKKWVKKRMGGFLHLNRMMNSSDFSLREGLKEAVYGFARSDTHSVVASGMGYRAEILERGGTIKAKKGKYLTFRGDDEEWHRMKSVTIPPKKWFSKSIAGFEESSEYLPTVDKVIGKAIKKAGLSV
jgi:hypothetical protein